MGVLPFMLGAIQSGSMAVVLKKTFTDIPGLSDDSLNLAVATLGASTAIGNLSSGVWAACSNGRRKLPFLAGLMVATSICVGLMGLVPRTAFGAWLLVGLVIAGWLAWSGVITIRTTVWRANYPDANRAQIAGRLATVQAIMMTIAGFMIGETLDYSSQAFRYLFPAMSLFGFLGAWLYIRVRLRGQNRLARAERGGTRDERPSLNPFAGIRVLKADRPYAGYMACMFVFGFGNLMIGPTLAIILTDQFQASYLEAILATMIIPLIVMPFAIPFWARLLDRIKVIAFRTLHSWVFVLASALYLIGVEFNLFAVVLVASGMLGLGFSGGMLAWNLGHQYFAPPHRDSQYMSVHVMLTGLRGLIAPFVGVLLYEMMAPSGHGGLIFSVTMTLNIVGAIGFFILNRKLNRP